MKRSKWIIKQAVLAALLCLFGQGCTGRERDSLDRNEWSFQAAQEETVSLGDAGHAAARENETAGEKSGAAAETEEEESGPAGYVYVCGAVQHPGVYEIHQDMRIFEVLELAGGMTGEADTDWLNQAQRVTDGQKLQIYTKEETELMRSSGAADGDMAGLSGSAGEEALGNTADGAAPAASEDKVNINTAGKEELMTLPGIGEAKADAILKYRQEHGSFGAIEEICQISGIKEAVFSNIKDRITV